MGLVRSLTASGGAVVKSYSTAAILYAVAGAVVLLAIAFALLAAFFAMAPHVGPIWSALIVAGGLLVVAIALAVVASVQIKRAKRRAAAFAAAGPMLAVAGPVAFGAAKRAPALFALALLAAGFLVARR